MIKFSSLAIAPKHSTIVALIALLALIAFIFDEAFSTQLVYNRHLISQGEYWRIFTGHFLHTNGYHYLLNTAALILLWALHGHFYTLKNYTFLFITSLLFCSAGMYYFSPDIIQYVGLSGVLHGVFVWGAVMDINAKDKTGYLLFIGVWLKIAHEQFYGASSDVISLIDASVAVDAHLWGATGGLFFSIIYLFVTKQSVSNKRLK